MQHSVKKMKFIIMLCVVFLFVGCGSGDTTGEASFDAQEEDNSESGQENEAADSLIIFEFTDVYLRITEPYGSSYILNGNVSQTEVEGHTYQFASDIAKGDCLSFIQAQETLCAFLKENGISTEGMLYRVLTDYSNWTDSEEETVYFGLNTMGSWEQVLTTIQVSLGDYTNYGYLYALANYVAGELGWETDTGVSTDAVESTDSAAEIEASDTDAAEETLNIACFQEDPYLLNLVYPCFDEVYTGAESIQACKALVLQVFDRLTNPYAGEEAFTDEIEAWAQEQGIDFTPTYLQFAYYSGSCPLKMETQYLEVFRTESYVADELYREGYITRDDFSKISTLLPAFEALDEQLADLCEIFDMYSADRIEVQLVDSISRSGLSLGGYFSHTPGYIRSISIYYIPHEYTHYLYYLSCGCSDPAFEGWYNEAVAYYYGSTLNGYEKWLLYDANLDAGYLTEIEDIIGEAYDEPADYIRLARTNARMLEDPQYLYYLKSESSGTIKSSFGEYFVRTYGEEAFLNSMMYPSRVEEYTGKTMDEILDDWEVDMADPKMDALVRYENICTEWRLLFEENVE